MKITAISKMKHAALYAAAKRLGGQNALARALNVDNWLVGRWCNLCACPPNKPTRNWPMERILALEQMLIELTGQTLEELFPDELRENTRFLQAPKTVERTRDIETKALLEYARNTTQRLEYNPESETIYCEERKQRDDAIEVALSRLDARERQIIEMRFGMCGHGELTLDETAEVLNRSRERVRQIEGKAIRKLQIWAVMGIVPELQTNDIE